MAERDYSHRSLVDKLGIKPDARVYVAGVADEDFLTLLRARTPNLATRISGGPFDVVVLGVARPADLDRIAKYGAAIKPVGGVWVVYPKGCASLVPESLVRDAGLAAGLVDNKVVSFSATHTGLRFVIRVADRG